VGGLLSAYLGNVKLLQRALRLLGVEEEVCDWQGLGEGRRAESLRLLRWLKNHYEEASGEMLLSEAEEASFLQVIRVRVEIMGSQKCRIVGKSQPVLIAIDPIIFARTRIVSCTHGPC
jgi:hypothetical protein